MTLDAIRNSLSFKYSDSNPECRICLFKGCLVADYRVVNGCRVMVTLYNGIGRPRTNVLYPFVHDAVDRIVSHVDFLIRAGRMCDLAH